MKLAINGAEKTVDIEGKHFVWPIITEKTKKAVLEQLDEGISIYDRSGIIKTLEDKFSKYVDKGYSLLTSSGTMALYSMYKSADLKEGDEVIAPAYTFYATVTPLLFNGATPILADCDKNGNIRPEEIEKKVNVRTKAIVVTHMWGVPVDMDPILSIAKKNNLLVFEDASHAHGAIYKGKKVGMFGNASVFSLQGNKTLTGGEGGILITDNPEFYYKSVLLGHYNKRCVQEIPHDNELYQFGITGMGLKLRIHPLAAAIANEQFDNLESVLEGRRAVAVLMMDRLKKIRGITVPDIGDSIKPSWYAMMIGYDSEKFEGLSIQRFYDALKAEGCKEFDIPSSTCPLNYHPLFQNPGKLFPNYKNKFSYRIGDFPDAEKFHNSTLKLPVWHREQDLPIVEKYLSAIEKVAENYKELCQVR